MRIQQKPIIHARDHLPGGADPIPGLSGGGDWEDAVRDPDLTIWWRLGDTFTFGSSVPDAMLDSADFDVDSPRNLDYAEVSSTNRPTLQVANDSLGGSDDGALELNFTAASNGPRLENGVSADDVTPFGTTGDQARTVMAWLKVKAGLGAIYGPVVGRWGQDPGASWNVGWVLEVHQTTYQLRFTVDVSGGPSLASITGPTLDVDTWYHVAVTFDGTTYSMYVNGLFYDDMTQGAPADSGGVSVGYALYDAGVTFAERYFYGSIDEIAFYKRVLDAGEIEELAAGGAPSSNAIIVTSLGEAGGSQLTGDVTLSEGTGVTITQSGQDIEIAAAGGSGIAESLLDAKGDLIVALAADTADVLAVGTDDYVLTADSGETLGVKWAAAAGGSGATLYADPGAPSGGLGSTGDLYLDTTSKFVYEKQLVSTPPTFRTASTKFDSASTSSRTCNLPTGYAAGDLLVMLINHTNLGTAVAPTTPTGWTRHAEHTHASTNSAIYSRVADGTEGSTVTITSPTSAYYVTMCILAYIGGTFDAYADYGSAQSGTTPTVPSVTTAAANEIVAGFVSSETASGSAAGTAAGTWTERADRNNSSAGGLAYAQDKTIVAAGASGTSTPTVTTGSHWTYALAVGGSAATPTWVLIGSLVPVHTGITNGWVLKIVAGVPAWAAP